MVNVSKVNSLDKKEMDIFHLSPGYSAGLSLQRELLNVWGLMMGCKTWMIMMELYTTTNPLLPTQAPKCWQQAQKTPTISHSSTTSHTWIITTDPRYYSHG
jgi:hypothetical protein